MSNLMLLLAHSASLVTGNRSLMRQPIGNKNMLPYNVNSTSTSNRYKFDFVRHKVANNANYSDITLTHSNYVSSGTAEGTNYPTVVLRTGIYVDGVTYPATYTGSGVGSNQIVHVVGTDVTTDPIMSLPAGKVFYEIILRIFPLKFDAQTVNFTPGMVEVVTGGTSGATGRIHSMVDNGTSGYLVLVEETGTFVDNEPLTGSLGGSATTDVTNQSHIYSVSGRVWFNEGTLSTNNSAIDYTVTHPVAYPDLFPTIVGNNISAVGKNTSGSGFTSGPSLYAYCWFDDQLWYKNIGYCSTSGGAITTRTVSDGTPPTGLTAWPADTKVIAAGGGSFGANTGNYCASLISGIPSVPVCSVLYQGASQDRGDSASDSTGDMDSNHGTERIIKSRCGIIQMSRSSASAAGDVSYSGTYARTYNLYMGKTTHHVMALGWNDLDGGAKTDIQLASYINTIQTYVRSFGTKSDVATILPHSIGKAITGASKATQCVVTVPGHAFQVGYSISFGDIVGMTQLNNTTATVVAIAGDDITIDVNSTGFGTWSSGGRAYYYGTDEALQTATTPWLAGGYRDLHNAKVRNGTIPSDNAPIDVTAFYDGIAPGKWRVDLGVIVSAQTSNNYESIHQNKLGYGKWAADATQYAKFNYLV